MFEFRKTAAAAQPLSAHREAILHALRALTGHDAGASAQEWRELLRAGNGESP